MASSATFLEEALSTDVDESAVSAIVGSLENQLGTPTSIVPCQPVPSTTPNQNLLHSGISNGSSSTVQKHGTVNGQSDTMSLILNSEPNKGIPSSSHQIGNITSTLTNSTVQGVVSSSGFVSQIQPSIGIVQTSNANLGKTQDGLKTVFATGAPNCSTVSSPRLAYPATNVGSLPNGNYNVTLPMSNVLNVTNSNVQGMVSQTFSQTGSNYHKITPIGAEQNKSATAVSPVIIKSSVCNNVQSTSSPASITTAVSVAGSQLNTAVTLAKSTTASGAQTIVGNPSILSNVQFLNIRTTAPNQQGNKTNVGPRFVIPQAVVGARPGQPGIALPGKTFVLKTENGSYQIVQLCPPPTANSSVNQNNTVAAIRLAVPAQQGCVTASSTAATSGVQTVSVSNQLQTATAAQRGNDNTREKCRRFLTNLLELSSREPKAVERNVRTLIQELIDSKVEPEEFCDRLERLLNASPQPCLIGFLKKSLPLLRAAMIAKETSIDGIRPPPAPTQSPATVVLAAPSAVVQAQLQNSQVRPVQIGSMQQMRVVPQTALPQATRPQQQMSRLVTPVRLQTATNSGVSTTGTVSGMKVVTTPSIPTVATTVRIQSPLPPSPAIAVDISNSPTGGSTVHVVPSSSNMTTPTPAVRLSTPVRQNMVKTLPVKMSATSSPAVRAASTGPIASKASAINIPSGGITKNSSFTAKSPMLAGITKQQSTANQSKSAAKDRDRKLTVANASTSAATAAVTALAGGYVGEDDVNDVAAMAGVNLAEETQRILGPSEFVGTQIRSCKDETFLHTHPLTMRIIEIAKKHGLDEPNPDVVALVSHAAQERLKNILEKLNVIAEHRVDFNKADKKYEISHDIRGQLRCLEELDKVERKRHDEMERELLLRAAKSRSKSEDPEQVKLKAKAKELQRAEMEELRQREANMTALQAIGPRKKIKLESADGQSGLNFQGSSNSNASANRLSMTSRPRTKRVTIRDFLYVMEKEKHINRSSILFKSYLK